MKECNVAVVEKGMIAKATKEDVRSSMSGTHEKNFLYQE